MYESRAHKQEELEADFEAHLQRQLGVDREAARELLGDWLVNYEPTRRRPIHVLERG